MMKTPASASLLSMNGPSVTMSSRIVVAVPGSSSASPATVRPPASAMRSGRFPCASITSGGSSAAPSKISTAY